MAVNGHCNLRMAYLQITMHKKRAATAAHANKNLRIIFDYKVFAI